MTNTVDYIFRKTESICKKAEELERAISLKSFDGITRAYSDIAAGCVELTNTVKLAAATEAPDVRAVNQRLSYITSADVIREDDITHIHFNSLLPVRPKGKYQNERDTILKTYIIPLNDAVREKAVIPYTEKVVIAIVHNFGTGSRLIDHDNFQTKPIIDGITSLLLPDDSPDWVSLYMDYRREETDSTDIYIIPYDKFKDFRVQKKPAS